MSNYLVGHAAEKRAAAYLKSLGFEIRQLNWKTRYCEIDIVAQKDGAVYFAEVKYRRSARQGYGTDYIGPRKLRQMQFAAEMWVSSHNWPGDYQLAVVSIDGQQVSFYDEL